MAISKPVQVGDYQVRFERRGYPRTTGGTTIFTWAEVLLDGEWYSLGDPWPKIRPGNMELRYAIEHQVLLLKIKKTLQANGGDLIIEQGKVKETIV